MTSEVARQQAQAEGLTLCVANNTTGYFCVSLSLSCKTKPFKVRRLLSLVQAPLASNSCVY